MAAVQALRTNVIKLVFIYSTVSQLGYMVLAVAAGGALGYAGGMLHVINHVFFKDLLFLVCGAVMFATHRETLDDLGGIGRKMPFTLAMRPLPKKLAEKLYAYNDEIDRELTRRLCPKCRQLEDAKRNACVLPAASGEAEAKGVTSAAPTKD